MESDVTLIPCGPSPLDLSPLRVCSAHWIGCELGGLGRRSSGAPRFSEHSAGARGSPALESTAQSLSAPAHVPAPVWRFGVGYAGAYSKADAGRHGDVLREEGEGRSGPWRDCFYEASREALLVLFALAVAVYVISEEERFAGPWRMEVSGDGSAAWLWNTQTGPSSVCIVGWTGWAKEDYVAASCVNEDMTEVMN
jgi:hypothetical protein